MALKNFYVQNGLTIGSNLMIFDALTSNATIGVSNATSNIGNVIVYGNSPATAANTGALQVRGGISFGGNAYVNGYGLFRGNISVGNGVAPVTALTVDNNNPINGILASFRNPGTATGSYLQLQQGSNSWGIGLSTANSALNFVTGLTTASAGTSVAQIQPNGNLNIIGYLNTPHIKSYLAAVNPNIGGSTGNVVYVPGTSTGNATSESTLALGVRPAGRYSSLGFANTSAIVGWSMNYDTTAGTLSFFDAVGNRDAFALYQGANSSNVPTNWAAINAAFTTSASNTAVAGYVNVNVNGTTYRWYLYS